MCYAQNNSETEQTEHWAETYLDRTVCRNLYNLISDLKNEGMWGCGERIPWGKLWKGFEDKMEFVLNFLEG